MTKNYTTESPLRVKLRNTRLRADVFRSTPISGHRRTAPSVRLVPTATFFPHSNLAGAEAGLVASNRNITS